MLPTSSPVPYGRVTQLIPSDEWRQPNVEFIHLQPYGQVEAWARKPYLSFFYGITLQTQGEVDYQANLQQHRVRDGALIFTFPNNLRAWQNESPDLAGTTVFVTEAYFARLAGVPPLLSYPFFQWSTSSVLPLAPAQVAVFEQLFRQLQGEFDRGAQRHDDILRHLLAALLLETERLYAAAPAQVGAEAGSRGFQLAERFKQLVAAQCAQQHQVAAYASQLHVTADHLSETVRQVTGQPASQHIQDLLLLRAKSLLQQTELSITAIADALGYDDSSYFGRFFRKRTGLTPQQYRKEPVFVR